MMSQNLLIIDWVDDLVHNELHENILYTSMAYAKET